MKKISISIDDEKIADLRKLAIDYDVPVSGLIVALINFALGKRGEDEEVEAHIQREVDRRRQIRGEAALKAITARWGEKEED